jgi:hypothetical protein
MITYNNKHKYEDVNYNKIILENNILGSRLFFKNKTFSVCKSNFSTSAVLLNNSDNESDDSSNSDNESDDSSYNGSEPDLLRERAYQLEETLDDNKIEAEEIREIRRLAQKESREQELTFDELTFKHELKDK